MRVLGIEGGGTKTSAALLDESGNVIIRARAGVSNTKLLTDSELAAVFRTNWGAAGWGAAGGE